MPDDRTDHPRPGESIHLRHAGLGGALCRAVVRPAPLVTEDIGYVTCAECRARLAKPAVAPAGPRAEPIASPGSGVFVRPVGAGVRLHAAARRFGVDSVASLCGQLARNGLNVTPDWAQVTCWGCRQIMKKRRAQGVER